MYLLVLIVLVGSAGSDFKPAKSVQEKILLYKRRFIYNSGKSNEEATTTAALINGGDGIKHTSAGGVEMGAVVGLGV